MDPSPPKPFISQSHEAYARRHSGKIVLPHLIPRPPRNMSVFISTFYTWWYWVETLKDLDELVTRGSQSGNVHCWHPRSSARPHQLWVTLHSRLPIPTTGGESGRSLSRAQPNRSLGMEIPTCCWVAEGLCAPFRLTWLRRATDFCPCMIVMHESQQSFISRPWTLQDGVRAWAAPGCPGSLCVLPLPSCLFLQTNLFEVLIHLILSSWGFWTLCFFETSPAGSVSCMAPVEMIFCHIAIESQVAEISAYPFSTKGYAQNCQWYLCRHCAPRYTWMAVNCQLLWQNDWRNQSAKYE